MTLYFSRFVDVVVTFHQHALRPAVLVFTWVDDGSGVWEQQRPREVGTLEAAKALLPPWAVPANVPPTFGIGAYLA